MSTKLFRRFVLVVFFSILFLVIIYTQITEKGKDATFLTSEIKPKRLEELNFDERRRDNFKSRSQEDQVYMYARNNGFNRKITDDNTQRQLQLVTQSNTISKANNGLAKQEVNFLNREFFSEVPTSGNQMVQDNRRKSKIWRFFLEDHITVEERNTFKLLLQTFYQVTEKYKLQFFLCFGTLLGSYRHHGMVPWDDDVDVMMNVTQRPQIKKALSSLSQDFILFSAHTMRWKLFHKSSQFYSTLPWAWPFLDISFYAENETHIWDIDYTVNTNDIYDKSIVFPLAKRPFMNDKYPVPKITKRFLDTTFDVNLCVSNAYSHKLEKLVQNFAVSIHCNKLKDFIPLVRRKELSTAVREDLYMGDKVMKTVFVKFP